MTQNVRLALAVVLCSCGGRGAFGQQQPDLSFNTAVAHPAYTDQHPKVLFDEAHNNFHVSTDRFKPFSDMITNDGYRITPNSRNFTPALLKEFDILIIANAMGAATAEDPDVLRSAFSAAECDAVRTWVDEGGALLLITDHPPYGAPSAALGDRFGVRMSKSFTGDPVNSVPGSPRYLVFSRENGLLGRHSILEGRGGPERVAFVFTFSGQALAGPPASVPLLRLAGTAVSLPDSRIGGAPRPAAGLAQGLAFRYGSRGRVVVLGEAAMLSAQLEGRDLTPMGMNTPGVDNRQFALNLMHWLSGLLKDDVPATPLRSGRVAVGGRRPRAAGATASRGPAPTRLPTQDAERPAPAPPDVRPKAPPKPKRPGVAETAPAPATNPNATSLAAADIAADSEPSVGLVVGKRSFGTGFLLAPGVLATNAHVIADEFIPDLKVRFPSAPDGKQGPYSANLLYDDPKRDLAFLAIKNDLASLPGAQAHAFRKGEPVTVIGNASDGEVIVPENRVLQGTMSSRTALAGQTLYQLSIAINPGGSGSPVFDATGRVIGMATYKGTKPKVPALTIPVDDLQSALAEVTAQPPAETERVQRRHRAAVAVLGLGRAGAVYCVAIDLHRAGAANPAIKATSDKVDAALIALEKETFSELTAETDGLRADGSLARSVRDKLGELATSFGKLRAAYAQPPAALRNDALKVLKAGHRRLMTELSTLLRLEPPPSMLMAAFNEHVVPPPSVIAIVPLRTPVRDPVQQR